MFFQEQFCIFTSLTDLIALVSIPCAALVHDVDVRCQIQDIPDNGNTFSEHDIEFRFLERRRNLVFNDFDTGTVADHFTALL